LETVDDEFDVIINGQYLILIIKLAVRIECDRIEVTLYRRGTAEYEVTRFKQLKQLILLRFFKQMQLGDV
jgi:hypothetical protein